MAEFLYATSHITGGATSPDNALGAADGTWTADTGNTNWTSRWAMGDPSGGLSGTQMIRVTARKDASGGNDPSAVVNLYENGSFVAELVASTSITSATGQTLTGTFSAGAITNEANIEIELATTGAGGNPSSRRAVQIDAIELEATVSGPSASGGSEGTVSVAPSGTGTKGAQQGTEGAISVSSSASGQKLAQAGTTADVSVLATGAGSGEAPSASGGAEAGLLVGAEALGTKVALAGSTSDVSVTVSALGTVRHLGAATSATVVTPTGSGQKLLASGASQGLLVYAFGSGNSGLAPNYCSYLVFFIRRR